MLEGYGLVGRALAPTLTGFSLKGTGFSLKGTGFSVKGMGFSPYINTAISKWALAPEVSFFGRFACRSTFFRSLFSPDIDGL